MYKCVCKWTIHTPYTSQTHICIVQIHMQKEEAMFADIPLWRKVLQFCSGGAAAAGARLT